jgi:hypothetical protein
VLELERPTLDAESLDRLFEFPKFLWTKSDDPEFERLKFEGERTEGVPLSRIVFCLPEKDPE